MKHFKDEVHLISFDYLDNYVENTTKEHKEMDIIASFEDGTLLGLSSVFAVFNEKPVTGEIPESKFVEAIRDSGDTLLDFHHYTSNGKDIVIAKTRDNVSGNTHYRCSVPELGFSVMFIVFSGLEEYFNKDAVDIVVKSINRINPKRHKVDSDYSAYVFCNHCGAKVDSKAKYCLNCGNPIKNKRG